MNKTLLNRLTRLEAAKPIESKPVDERAFRASINLMLAGGLIGLARALGCKDESELFHVACNDGAEFVRRYVVVKPPCRAHQAQGDLGRQMRQAQDDERAAEARDVRVAVIHQFFKDEFVHTMIDEAFPWWDERPGLSAERPCRPA